MNLISSKLFGCCKLYRRILVFVSLGMLHSVLPQGALADDQTDIRTAFSALQHAFVARDGSQALGYLSSDTRDYYRMLSRLAGSKTTPEQLTKAHLTPLNLMMIQHAKKDFPKSFWVDANKTNLDKLLKFAVDKGLGSKELTDNIVLGKIEVKGTTASGQLMKGIKVMPVQLGFQKEGEEWKVSLLAMFEETNRLAEAYLKKYEMTTADLEKLVLQ